MEIFGLHFETEPLVDVVDGKELGAVRCSLAKQAKQPAGEGGVSFTRQHAGHLVALRRGENVGAVHVELAEDRSVRGGHQVADYPAGEAAVQDHDLVRRRAVEDRATQFVVLQGVELRRLPFAVGKSEIEFVTFAAHQAVARVVDEKKVLRLRGCRPEPTPQRAHVSFIHQGKAVGLGHHSVIRIGESFRQVIDVLTDRG